MTDRRLTWVARNRVRADRTRRAGELIGAAVLEAKRPDGGAMEIVAKALGGRVDEEFRRHCRIAAVRGGLLHIHVDAPSLVSAMRTRWRSVICEALRTTGREVTAREVVFGFGREGVLV